MLAASMFWPMFVALGVLALAYLLFRMLPEVVDQGAIYLWIVGAFLVVYIAAAYYLHERLPRLLTPPVSSSPGSSDIVRSPDRL